MWDAENSHYGILTVRLVSNAESEDRAACVFFYIYSYIYEFTYVRASACRNWCAYVCVCVCGGGGVLTAV